MTTRNMIPSSRTVDMDIFAVAKAGVVSDMQKVLNNGADINVKDDRGRSATSWASELGNYSLVQLLLIRGADPAAGDDNSRTPLSWAAGSGYENIVNSLLAKEVVEPDSENKDGRTPLSWASGKGHDRVVKQLLEEPRVDPDSKDKDSYTPLVWAAKNGHAEVVKQLLAVPQVDLNSTGAAELPLPPSWEKRWTDEHRPYFVNHSTGTTTWLDPRDLQPGHHLTPLSWAARNGHSEVVKQLLAKSWVNPNFKDKDGNTSLSLAIKNGHAGVVEQLLAKPRVDLDSEHGEGKMILLWAMKNGYTGVLQQLLAEPAVDLNTRDEEGNTALLWAIKNGHMKAVRQLVAEPRVDLNFKDKDGRTPLSWATENGHIAVMMLLREEGRVIPDSSDKTGWTPLSWAAKYGNTEAVKQLVAEPRVDLNSKDKDGRTPLSWASENGHIAVVMLLGKEANIIPDSSDKNGLTPLSWAAKNGHEGVVNILLAQQHVNPVSRDKTGWTPLSWAVKNGHDGVVKLLIDKDGVTLHLLVKEGDQTLVESLLGAGYDVNAQDSSGVTPLQLAVQRKDRGLIQVLLQNMAEAKDIMAKEWRDAFGKENAEVLQICKGSNGMKSVEFPTADKLSQISAQTENERHLFVFVDESLWSKVPINDSKGQLESSTLQISLPRETNSDDIDVSVSFRFPVDRNLSQKRFGIRDGSECKIAWKMKRPTNPSDAWRPMVYFSMLPYGWIPHDGFDLFTQFMIYLKERWMELCQQAEEHLTKRRLDQLRSEGKSPALMHHLAEDAETLAHLRSMLKVQVGVAEAFVMDYSQRYNANETPPDLKKLLTHEFALSINNRIGQLDQTVRDLLQIEFAWASITETRISTRLAQNVMLLTYVSIFYLPLAMCAALWAIPGISESATRNPFIITSTTVGLITLFVAFNLENIAALMGKVYQHWRNKIVTSMRRDDRWKEMGRRI